MAAAVTTEPVILSGGSDSVVNVWRDVTPARAAAHAARGERRAAQAQRLANAVHARQVRVLGRERFGVCNDM